MRIGATKRPFYRVVAVDERKKRTGEYLELLGTYNPLTEPKEIILKQDKIDEWIKKGAVLSDGYLRMTKQAPQRPPRKPKKEKKDKEPSATSPQTSEVPADTSDVIDREAQTESGGSVSEAKADSSEVEKAEETPADTSEKVEEKTTEEETK